MSEYIINNVLLCWTNGESSYIHNLTHAQGIMCWICFCKLIYYLFQIQCLKNSVTNVFHCLHRTSPESQRLKFFCAFVCLLEISWCSLPRQEGSPSKGSRRVDGWSSVCDAPVLHHSPVISHLEWVNQDSVYAQLCSPDRFIQCKLVFLGLQRQRKCKLFKTVYHRDQCFFEGCGS